MLLRVALFLLAAAQALAHRIEVEPGQKECFHEMLSSKDRVGIAPLAPPSKGLPYQWEASALVAKEFSPLTMADDGHI